MLISVSYFHFSSRFHGILYLRFRLIDHGRTQFFVDYIRKKKKRHIENYTVFKKFKIYGTILKKVDVPSAVGILDRLSGYDVNRMLQTL